jgi:TRAP-type uncharacterized transport system fused permease subunit
MVTPPVALAAYAAAGLSNGNLWNTGLMSFVLAIPGFLIPYAFVFDQAILLQGDPLHVGMVFAAATLGIIALSAATGGYLFGPLTWPVRAVLFASAPFLIDPAITTSLIGGAGVLLVIAYQVWRTRVVKAPTVQPARPGE